MRTLNPCFCTHAIEVICLMCCARDIDKRKKFGESDMQRMSSSSEGCSISGTAPH